MAYVFREVREGSDTLIAGCILQGAKPVYHRGELHGVSVKVDDVRLDMGPTEARILASQVLRLLGDA